MLNKPIKPEEHDSTEPTTSDLSYPPDIVCGTNLMPGISLFKSANDKPIVIGEKGLKASRILAQIKLEENQEKLLEDLSRSLPKAKTINSNKMPDQLTPPPSSPARYSSFSSSGGSLKRSCPISPIKGQVTPIIKYRRGSATQFKPPTISDTGSLPTKVKVHNKHSIQLYNSDNQVTRIPLTESSISLSSLVTPPETPNQSMNISPQDIKGSMEDWSSENHSDESFDFDEDDDAELSRFLDTSLKQIESSTVQNGIH